VQAALPFEYLPCTQDKQSDAPVPSLNLHKSHVVVFPDALANLPTSHAVGVGVVGAGVVALVGVVGVGVVVGAGGMEQESAPPAAFAQQSLLVVKVPVKPVLHLQSDSSSLPVASVVSGLPLASVFELSGQLVQACDPTSGLNLPSGQAAQASSGPV
jgi:hypothetical protein